MEWAVGWWWWGVALCSGAGVALSALLAWALREYVAVPLGVLRRLRAQGIPGHPFRPLVGQLPLILGMRSRREAEPGFAASTHGTQFWFDGAKEFGSLWHFSSGRRMFLVIGDPALARQAYVAHSHNFAKTEILTSIRILGDGLLTSSGAHWTRQRRLINPAFSHKEIKRIFPTMVECTQQALAGVRARALQGETVLVDEAWSGLTLDIISRSAFGSQLDSVLGPQHLHSLTHTFPTLLEDSVLAAQMTGVMPFFKYLPLALNRRVRKAEEVMERALRQIVSARLEKHRQSQQPREQGEQHSVEGEEQEGRTDLLELMLNATEGLDDPGTAAEKAPLLGSSGGAAEKKGSQKLSVDLLMANCFTFLLAGHETTGNMLTWTSLLLSQHPEWQEKAREEVNALYAANGGKTPTFEQLGELKVVGWILNESMRLYPPASLVDRTCVKTTVLSEDVTVPEGCCILIPISVIHRSKELWGQDADAFRPDRFAEGVSKAAAHPGAFMPFSMGPRNCIGQNFALAEAKVILAMFLRSFSWKLSEGYQHFPDLSITLRAKRGMPLDLTVLSEP